MDPFLFSRLFSSIFAFPSFPLMSRPCARAVWKMGQAGDPGPCLHLFFFLFAPGLSKKAAKWTPLKCVSFLDPEKRNTSMGLAKQVELCRLATSRFDDTANFCEAKKERKFPLRRRRPFLLVFFMLWIIFVIHVTQCHSFRRRHLPISGAAENDE